MQNKTSNVNFTSNIRFIPYKGYEKLSQKLNTVHVNEMWTIGQVREVQGKGATDQIIYCVAGIVKNLKTKRDFIFHWFPKEMFENTSRTQQNTLNIKEAIKHVANHKDANKGFLIGGIGKSDETIFENSLSIKLINFLKNTFRKAKKTDFTMFFSQASKNTEAWERPQSAFIYNKKTDTYYVNCKTSKKEKWRNLLNKDEIRNHFGYISISPGDKVFIGREQIPNEFLNKRKS